MDPELYVFPQIQNLWLKIIASTALFALVVSAANLLPYARLWTDLNSTWSGSGTILIGYCVFIFASVRAWQATREKNRAEDPKREIALRLLDSGPYAAVRHPMYGMFMLANAGLGLAANTVYGLVFSLLSLVMFTLNGIIEERFGLIPQFDDQYRDYMKRVRARYFTLPQALLIAAVLGLNVAGYFLR